MNVASAMGELESLDDVDERECLSTIAGHEDVIVGLKIRLQKQISRNGENEQEAFRLGQQISQAATFLTSSSTPKRFCESMFFLSRNLCCCTGF